MKPLLALPLAALGLALASPALAASDNLLLNPSFEYETAGDFHSCVFWSMNHPNLRGDTYGSARRENWRAHDGFYMMALRGAWAGAGDSGGCWQEVPAQPGAAHRFSAWAWADAAWTAPTRELKLEYWNADHSRLLATHALPLENLGESWREFSISASAPEGAAWARAIVHMSGAGPEGALLVDSLVLQSGAEP